MGRALALLVVLAPAAASADTFKLFGEIHAGGMYGKGIAGAQQNASFFENSPHGMYGAEIGAEFLFLDAWIQHHQYTDGSRLTTWTQFGLGIHNTMDLGSSEEQKAGKGNYFEIGGGAWFGIGTGQQVMPPLDNAQVSDKGFLLEGRAGFGIHFSRELDLGLQVPVSYGFFFKNGVAANDVSNQYRGWQAELLVALRGNLHLF
jgi:hypothetical protein